MKPTNLDQEKLDLEKEKFARETQFKESELQLKQQEFDLKQKELRRRWYRIPTIQGGIAIALIGIASVIVNNYSKHIIEQKQEVESPKPQPLITTVDSNSTSKQLPPSPVIRKQPVVQVYICNSKTSHVYHKSDSCGHLSNCKSDIKQISIDKAREMFRKPCRFEY